MQVPSTIAIDFGGSAVRVSLRHEHRDRLIGTVAVQPDVDILPATGVLLDEALGQGAVHGAAVALPGTVDPATGGILGINGKYEWLLGHDVVGWVSQRLALPRGAVALSNDARAALVGELHEGAARGFRDAVLVILGTGVGTAVAHDGQVWSGAFGHAGVLGGHLVIDYLGPVCTCGNRGCAEAVLGSWALPTTWQRAAHTSPPPTLGYRELLDLVAGHDPAAVQVWATLQLALTALLTSLCHAHDPEVVVLSGGPLQHPHFDVDDLRTRLHASLFVSSHRPALRVAAEPGLSVVKGLHHLAATRQD